MKLIFFIFCMILIGLATIDFQAAVIGAGIGVAVGALVYWLIARKG